MSRPSFTEIQAQEDSVNRLQKNIKTAINPVLALPFSAGVHKKDVAITTSDTLVNHGLDRQMVGYFVTKQNADTNIFVACVMGFDAAATIGDPNSISIGGCWFYTRA